MIRKLISPWAYPDEIYFAEQFNYGHREVLLSSNGLALDSIFRAKLQHGWMPRLDPNSIEISKKITRVPSLVWSKRLASSLSKEGIKNTIVIGAPWVHLLRALSFNPTDLNQKESRPSKVIYFPNHSDIGFKASLSEKFLTLTKDLQVEHVTVSLFWKDFINPAVRAYYSRDFSSLLCHGFRGSSGFEIPWSDEGGRTMYLPNLLKALISHDTVVVSPWSTAFWYALSLRKKIFIPDVPDVGYHYNYNQSTNTLVSLKDMIKEVALKLPVEQVFLPSLEHVTYALEELGWNESLDIMRSKDISKLLRTTKISPDIGAQVSTFIYKNSGGLDNLQI